MFSPRSMPCAECAESVDVMSADAHRCDETRRLEYQMRALRAELLELDAEVRAYLDSNEGRFERWLAERTLHGDA